MTPILLEHSAAFVRGFVQRHPCRWLDDRCWWLSARTMHDSTLQGLPCIASTLFQITDTYTCVPCINMWHLLGLLQGKGNTQSSPTHRLQKRRLSVNISVPLVAQAAIRCYGENGLTQNGSFTNSNTRAAFVMTGRLPTKCRVRLRRSRFIARSGQASRPCDTASVTQDAALRHRRVRLTVHPLCETCSVISDVRSIFPI